MTKLRFGPTIAPQQGKGPKVVCFSATPQDIVKIARIERIGRDSNGHLSGFQRPQIASHIREISDYLALDDAMLPNAVVLAFAKGCSLSRDGSVLIDTSQGPPGWVVDGQQRLCAALTLPQKRFEFLVSSFLCDDMAELNRQFILVNNTRPISKPLIYELLPGLDGLPHRLSDRAGAALLTESLNYGSESSLHGQINQQTHPDGTLKDTVIHRLLLNSLQQGALRSFAEKDALLSEGVSLVSTFFSAVQRVFEKDWKGHTPKTSRLLHGVGLISMGYVMDEIAIRTKAKTKKQFEAGLEPLVGKTRWTSGEWNFGSERRPWNGLQNTKSDYRLVSHYLVRLVRRALVRSAA
jgi:DGQHR domain-containing protein